MKLIIKKELFLKGLNVVEKNIGKNLTLPVLNNILIKTTKNYLQFISTDLEIAISILVPAKIESEGSIVLSPRILSNFLSNISEGNIHIKQEKNILHFEQNEYKTFFKGESDKEYPLLPKINKKLSFFISSQRLIDALTQVINSVAISDLKPELTGILFDFTKNQIKIASTDSFRLSEKTIQQQKGLELEKKIIIPLKTAKELIRNYQNTNQELQVYLDGNQISISNSDSEKTQIKIQIISKLIEGEYPEYSQIIPKEFETKIIVSKKEFNQQIKAASLFASKINDVKLYTKTKKIFIHTENLDIGQFKSNLDALIEGKDIELVFNYQYLLDGLDNIKGDEIIIKSNKKDRPVLLESTKNKDYFYILMPIRN